jgi:hypothetical protein
VDGSYLLPLHPLAEKHHQRASLVQSGSISFSASYRTVFYTPEAGGPLHGFVEDNQALMLKLHLAEPLPGIAGDRRLTDSIIDRCISVSNILQDALRNEEMASDLVIVPEEFGITDNDAGMLVRILPKRSLVPLFSVYSADRSEPDEEPLIATLLRRRFGSNRDDAAEALGDLFARPLIRSVVAGFRAGFSLEMHAQNTLVSLDDDKLIDKVWFRDIEGVLLFNDLRLQRNVAPLLEDVDFLSELQPTIPASRYFNRNVDHDLGRVFAGVLLSLGACRFFNRNHCRLAEKAIRRVVRQAISEGEVSHLAGIGSLVPISRAPWGSGRRLGHYFRTRFR